MDFFGFLIPKFFFKNCQIKLEQFGFFPWTAEMQAFPAIPNTECWCKNNRAVRLQK